MTEELVEHIGDVQDGTVTCSCGGLMGEGLSPEQAVHAYTEHLDIPWWSDPNDHLQGWENALRVGHLFTIGAHERAYGVPLGELKTPPGKGRIKTMLNNLRRDGELTSQQAPYSQPAPVAPDVPRETSGSDSEQEQEGGNDEE